MILASLAHKIYSQKYLNNITIHPIWFKNLNESQHYFECNKDGVLLVIKYPNLTNGKADKELIQQYGQWITTYFNYPNMSLGLYNEFNNLTHSYLNSYKSDTLAMQNILNITNNFRKVRKQKQFNSFKEILQYFDKQISIFFKHLAKVCYTSFEIM